MNFTQYLGALECGGLSERQLENLGGISRISRGLHEKTGLETRFSKPSSETVVIESGHQPNFLPHAGVFKKIFLMGAAAEKMRESGRNPICLFGFADYNLSTAELLFSNKIPAKTREGYLKIGFNVSKDDRWRGFNTFGNPGEDDFKKILEDIGKTYLSKPMRKNPDFPKVGRNVEAIMEILKDCYNKSESLSGFNESAIMRITKYFGIGDIHFFRYTDVQENHVFLEEAEKLAEKTGEYNNACNKSVSKRGLEELGVAEDYFYPLWYHCPCGGKTTLSAFEDVVQGRCPVCEKFHKLEVGGRGLKEYYSDMSPTAIARNLIFSEGLGTALFISGTGGGLKYGQIANDVAEAIGFHVPQTIAWNSSDAYLGAVQENALFEIARTLGKDLGELLKKGVSEASGEKTRMLKELAEKSREKKERQKHSGRLKNIQTSIGIIRNMLGTTYSILDLLANYTPNAVTDTWSAVSEAAVSDGEFGIIEKDCIYPDSQYPTKDIVSFYAREVGK